MSDDAKKIGWTFIIQSGSLLAAVGVAWGTLKAQTVALDARVTHVERAVNFFSDNRSELKETLARLEERVKAIQERLERSNSYRKEP